MPHPIHLVVDLDDPELPVGGQAGFIQSLSAAIASWPGSVLTLLSRTPGAGFQTAAPWPPRPVPVHLAAEGGAALFHRNGTESWTEDAAFPEWLSFNRGLECSRACAPGVPQPPDGAQFAFAVALQYLEIFHGAPRPQVLHGPSHLDYKLLNQCEVAIPAGPARRREALREVAAALGLARPPAELQRVFRVLGTLGPNWQLAGGARSPKREPLAH